MSSSGDKSSSDSRDKDTGSAASIASGSSSSSSSSSSSGGSSGGSKSSSSSSGSSGGSKTTTTSSGGSSGGSKTSSSSSLSSSSGDKAVDYTTADAVDQQASSLGGSSSSGSGSKASGGLDSTLTSSGSGLSTLFTSQAQGSMNTGNSSNTDPVGQSMTWDDKAMQWDGASNGVLNYLLNLNDSQRASDQQAAQAATIDTTSVADPATTPAIYTSNPTVTAEGLNVRPVQTVGVDANGQPITSNAAATNGSGNSLYDFLQAPYDARMAANQATMNAAFPPTGLPVGQTVATTGGLAGQAAMPADYRPNVTVPPGTGTEMTQAQIDDLLKLGAVSDANTGIDATPANWGQMSQADQAAYTSLPADVAQISAPVMAPLDVSGAGASAAELFAATDPLAARGGYDLSAGVTLDPATGMYIATTATGPIDPATGQPVPQEINGQPVLTSTTGGVYPGFAPDGSATTGGGSTKSTGGGALAAPAASDTKSAYGINYSMGANKNWVSPSQQYANADAGMYEDPSQFNLVSGEILGANGYVYKQNDDGSYYMVGDINSVTPAPQATAQTAAGSTASTGDSAWDKVVNGVGNAFSKSGYGSLIKNLFPDAFYGFGETMKSLDNGTTAASAAAGRAPPPATLAPSQPNYTPAAAAPTTFVDANGNGVDDALEGYVAPPASTDSSGYVNTYDRNGYVTFPGIPPYDPGQDPEWVYFRKQGYADGGIVAAAPPGAAMAGPAGMPAAAPPPDGGMGKVSAQDPRVQLIGATEQAMNNAIAGKVPGPDDKAAMQKFVSQFGESAFKQLFANVKAGQTMQASKARMVQGKGTGKSDSIPARIDSTKEAKLSNGEFVWPAETVAKIGGGDPMAGAQKLQELNDRLMASKAPPAPAAPSQTPVNVEQVG